MAFIRIKLVVDIEFACLLFLYIPKSCLRLLNVVLEAISISLFLAFSAVYAGYVPVFILGHRHGPPGS